jgi:parvulin-like peptidyl-prolyl isomerase
MAITKRRSEMKKLALVLLAIIVMASTAQAAMTFEVKDNKAVIKNTLTNQAVSAMGQNGQAIKVPAKQDVTVTYDPITKEQAQMQVIQLNTQRAQVVARNNAQLKDIDAQIKLFKDIDVALVATIPEEPTE